MISPKSIVGMLAVFVAVVALGFVCVSEQPTSAQEIFPSNPIMQPMPMTPGPQIMSSQEGVQTLIRAVYPLPASAAEKLTAVFDEESTALVECRTDDGEGALVDFVVTAEPATQNAISTFINTVFPKDNFVEAESNPVDPPTPTPDLTDQ